MKSKVIFSLLFLTAGINCMNHKIAIIGTGYVGLVSGTCLAEVGHTVICADVVKKKIDLLHHGELPIFEPGLQELVEKNVDLKRLSFTGNVISAIEQANIIFIAVGTPSDNTGRADLSYVKQVARTIGEHLNGYKVIVNKSTVPIGTGKKIRALIAQHASHFVDFDVVSNPEFLREGSAVSDFLMPDRIVVGCESERAHKIMAEIYEPFTQKNIPLVVTNIETAETIKYASNSFLATKIAFINEIYRLCDQTGADIGTVAKAMGLDHRISPYFLNPGPGFGGSCFPKDVQALIRIGEDLNLDLPLVNAALASNSAQKQYVVTKIEKLLSDNVAGKTIAVLGLAFKANTDDIRDSSAIHIIKQLLDKGAFIKAYDPQAMEHMKELFNTVHYCLSPYDAAKDADLCVVLTEWPEFKKLDLEILGVTMKRRLILDMRNILEVKKLNDANFDFVRMDNGRHVQIRTN